MTISHRKKAFQFLRSRVDPTKSCLNAQCITHCSNMSFCQLLLICFVCHCKCCHTFVQFLDNLNSLFLFVLRVMSVSLVALSCLIVCFQLISHLSDYVFIKHISSRNVHVINSFNSLCFVELVCAKNCKQIFMRQIEMLNQNNSDN